MVETHVDGFRGEVVLVFFGFTQCHHVHETTFTCAVQVRKKLDGFTDRPQAIFITIGLERDTRDALKIYTAIRFAILKGNAMKYMIVASFMVMSTATAAAQITVKDPWVRATVPLQTVTGAFMHLTAHQNARLVEVHSPVAATAEVHETTIKNNVMRMRAVTGLDLPAAKAVELRPGGYHVMLFDLKQQLKDGDIVPLTLVVEGKDKKRETIELRAPVRPLNSTQSTMQHTH